MSNLLFTSRMPQQPLSCWVGTDPWEARWMHAHQMHLWRWLGSQYRAPLTSAVCLVVAGGDTTPSLCFGGCRALVEEDEWATSPSTSLLSAASHTSGLLAQASNAILRDIKKIIIKDILEKKITCNPATLAYFTHLLKIAFQVLSMTICFHVVAV